MSIEVGQLAEHEQCKAGVHENLVGVGRGSRRVRAEYPVRDVEACQGPVVGTVFEDVAGGHGGVAETVHEDGLVLALEKVQCQHRADEELGLRRLGERLVVVEVEEWTEGEEEESWD